jgi:hypothetical protein
VNCEIDVDFCRRIGKIPPTSAEVAKLADALRSGRSEHYAHVGSNPTFGIQSPLKQPGFFVVNLTTGMVCRRDPRPAKGWNGAGERQRQ